MQYVAKVQYGWRYGWLTVVWEFQASTLGEAINVSRRMHPKADAVSVAAMIDGAELKEPETAISPRVWFRYGLLALAAGTVVPFFIGFVANA